MKAKLLAETNGLRSFALVFDKGDEVTEKLLEFARANRFAGAQVSAIGAFSEVKLGFFDRHEKTYKPIPLQEQVEVLAFTGNIVEKEGTPMLHAHIVVGKADGHGAWRTSAGRPRMAHAGNDIDRIACTSPPHAR